MCPIVAPFFFCLYIFAVSGDIGTYHSWIEKYHEITSRNCVPAVQSYGVAVSQLRPKKLFEQYDA
jgi:hypothetical protein